MAVAPKTETYLIVELVNAFSEGFLKVNPTEDIDEEAIDNITKIFRNQISTLISIFEHYNPSKKEAEGLAGQLSAQKQYTKALEEELQIIKAANTGMKKDADIYKNYADTFLEIIKSLTSK